MTFEREVIKRILADVGAIPGIEFGKSGLTLPLFKIEKEFLLSYEDGHQEKFPLWSGQGILSDNKIRALLVDLTDGEMVEYALAIRVNDKPIYALKLMYDNEDDGIFMLQESINWVIPSMLVKIWALLGMEMIIDQGMLWQPSMEYEDLSQALSHLIEM